MSESNDALPASTTGHVVLKKRKKRGNLRDRKTDEEDDNEDISIVDKMVELKSDQSDRTKRHKVISTLDIGGLNGRAGDGPVVEKSMKEMIGSQFAIQENEQYGGTISHENLLEKYITEKIGQGESTIAAEVELTEEEKLYRVPQEIKDMEGRSLKEEDDEAKGQVLSVDIGISEVALPSTYKLHNIAATEEAKRKRQDKAHEMYLNRVQAKQKTLCLGNTATSYLKKVQHDEWKAYAVAVDKARAEERRLKDNKDKTGMHSWNKGHPSAASSENNYNNNHHQKNYAVQSKDNAVLQKFIRAHMHKGR